MNSSNFSISTLSDEDTLYLENVMVDLRSYVRILQTSTQKNIVLLFPPINNFRRFLIHNLVENTFQQENLSTLSVGCLYARRTVVYPSVLKPMDVKCSDFVSKRRSNVDKKVDTLPIYRPPALRNTSIESENSCNRKERKTRKPDLQIYVPRARRSLVTDSHEDQGKTHEIINSPLISNSKQPSLETLHTPKKKKIISPAKLKKDTCDTSMLQSNAVIDISEKESIDDLLVEDTIKLNSHNLGDTDVNSNRSVNLIIETSNFQNLKPSSSEIKSIDLTEELFSEEERMLNVSSSSDADKAAKSNSSTSDEKSDEILIESNLSVTDANNSEECQMKNAMKDDLTGILSTSSIKQEEKQDVKITPDKKPLCDCSSSDNSSLQQSSALNVNDCEWDELFDEEGEYVDKNLIQELMTAVGKVSVQHAAQDYKQFQTSEERTSDGGCVVEIYGFPAEFKTDDLLSAFVSYRGDPGFQIVWVDDTHALAVFSSPTLADEVLNAELPFVKTRPIKNAMPKSRMKAQNFIMPPVSRPKTCVSLARRLVSGHLGMKINVTDQQRAAEKKILSDAREKRRLVAKQKQDAWEGTS